MLRDARGRFIKSNNENGNGLTDLVKEGYTRVKNFIKGPREYAPPSFQHFLNQYGSIPIVSIAVARKPIKSGIKYLADIISHGKFSERRRQLGYDDVFHNYLLVTLNNGLVVLLEKNQVWTGRLAKPNDFQNVHPIRLLKHENMNEMFYNASKRGKDFWIYHPSESNCQIGVKDLIDSNGLNKNLNKATEEIVNPQDGKALLDTLGKLRNVPAAITDLAGRLDRLYEGGSLNQQKHPMLSVHQFFDIINKK